MVKRTQRGGARPARKNQPVRPEWPAQGHSGEGSASALEVLQKLERGRFDGKPAEPREDDPPR